MQPIIMKTTFTRYDRVNEILQGEPALRKLLSTPSITIQHANGNSKTFSQEIVTVTDAIHETSRDANTMPKRDIAAFAGEFLLKLKTVSPRSSVAVVSNGITDTQSVLETMLAETNEKLATAKEQCRVLEKKQAEVQIALNALIGSKIESAVFDDEAASDKATVSIVPAPKQSVVPEVMTLVPYERYKDKLTKHKFEIVCECIWMAFQMKGKRINMKRIAKRHHTVLHRYAFGLMEFKTDPSVMSTDGERQVHFYWTKRGLAQRQTQDDMEHYKAVAANIDWVCMNFGIVNNPTLINSVPLKKALQKRLGGMNMRLRERLEKI